MRSIPKVALAAIALALSPAMAADLLRTVETGAPWCEDLGSLRPYIAALVTRDAATLEGLQSCAFLKGGVSVEILRDYAELGQGVRVVQVRVYGNRTSVDGYMLSQGLEPR